MNYSLLKADRKTHLKIVALALICSTMVGIALNAKPFAASVSKLTLTVMQYAADTGAKPVCRLSALQ
jgi:hypothetical protein